jgi:hypothetical protein
MMEGTDHDEMGRGSSSFQQNSANCKFDSVEAAFSIAAYELWHSRRFVYESYGAPPKKVKVEQWLLCHRNDLLHTKPLGLLSQHTY